ncbi:MAG: hypothetical protein ACLGHQ_10485, partial [Acidimicrobiia bacterium]
MKPHRRNLDAGTALPLVLVITVVLGAVVLAVSSYATASLKYGHVTEDRSDRLAAADAGMRYALDQIKLRNGCVFDDTVHVLPGVASSFNGATASVTCQLLSDGLDDGQLFAVVATGENVPAGDLLLGAQGGGGSDEPKTLGGPVYLSRVTNESMAMSAPLIIENGMLYYDAGTGTGSCTSITQASAISMAEGYLEFDPGRVYGPWCLRQSWKEKFLTPWVPDLTTLPVRNGSVSLATDPVNGSFTDITESGKTCRVFEPGRYNVPPDVSSTDSYFKSGDYLFAFPNSNAKFDVKGGIATMGKPNPAVTPTGNDRATSAICEAQQAADPATNGYGASVYLAGRSHIEVSANGAVEIHARQQANYYVSVQTLCNPSPNTWCRHTSDGAPAGFAGGDGNLGGSMVSSLDVASSSPRVLYTNSGNNKEFVAHGYFYAPLAKAEFGNATSTAEQKLLGGIVAAQIFLQSSASATNFEIAVPTSPLTGTVAVTSTAVKNGTTQIRAIIEFRYEQENPDDR